MLYIMFMTHLMSISDVRSNLPDLVGKVNATLSRVTITVNGQPKAVILSAEEPESLEETAEILTIPGIRESVKQGLKEAKKGRGVALSSL